MAVVDAPSRTAAARAARSAPAGALVLGADYRALGVVRSLGRRGVPVWVIRDGDDALAARSRYARRRLDWPRSGPGAQLAFLLGLADSGADGFALIPSGDETAAFVARNHAALSARYAVTVPPWATMRFAYDKRLTYPLATALGLDAPWTASPRDRADLAARKIRYPVVLKPAFKETFNRLTAAKAWRVDDRAALLRRYDEACALVAPETIMVQELIPGGGEAQFSYAALCVDGEPLAAVTARRTRQYPADFGRASTYVETVDRPQIEAPARALLRELGWTGLVEVEFKLDPRDGRHKLLDVNPRVWGWHTLCGRAGVDFPDLLWRVACGEPVPPVTARPGVRWVRTTTDLPVVAREVLARRMSLRAYARSRRGPREGAIFARDDLGPAVSEVPQLVSVLARRLAEAMRCRVTLETGDPRWGRFVAAHPDALPYHHPSWAATLAACYGFRPFVAAVLGTGGEIEAGLPVMEVAHRPRGGARWVALPFNDRCPALAADAAAERALAEALPAAAAAARVGTVQVRAPLAGLVSAPVAVQHVLDLSPGPDAVARGFSSAARRGVRKARREGVEIRVGATEDDLARVYYALHLQTRRRLGVPVQPRRFFRLLWQRVLAPGHGRLLLACVDGAPIAGAVFLEAGPTVIYKYGASDAAAWGRRPNNLLFAEAIASAAERGFTAFDFGRSDLADTGLRAFKAGWGAEERPLVYAGTRGAEPASAPGAGRRGAGPAHPPLAARRLPRARRGAVPLRGVALLGRPRCGPRATNAERHQARQPGEEQHPAGELGALLQRDLDLEGEARRAPTQGADGLRPRHVDHERQAQQPDGRLHEARAGPPAATAAIATPRPTTIGA